MCSWTHGKRETSLNEVARESIRLYCVCDGICEHVFEISLNFFQKPPAAHIFINCINLSKFVEIIFDTYVNFIKLSNILKFSKKEVQNFNKFFLKFTQILFIIYHNSLKMFSKIFKISAKFFLIFF